LQGIFDFIIGSINRDALRDVCVREKTVLTPVWRFAMMVMFGHGYAVEAAKYSIVA